MYVNLETVFILKLYLIFVVIFIINRKQPQIEWQLIDLNKYSLDMFAVKGSDPEACSIDIK